MRQPELAKAIFEALDNGVPKDVIARDLQVSRQTVTALQARPEAYDIEQRKQWEIRQIKKLESVSDKMLSRMEAAMDNEEFKVSQLPVAYGILVDKRDKIVSQETTGGSQEQTDNISNILNDLHKIASRSTVAVQVNHYHGSQGDSRETRVHDVTMETQETDG